MGTRDGQWLLALIALSVLSWGHGYAGGRLSGFCRAMQLMTSRLARRGRKGGK